MVDSRLLNGLNLFEIKIRKTGLTNDLSGLKMAILAIVDLLVEGSLNCVSISVQDIASISVKLTTDSFFCSVVEIRHRKRGILKSQKLIGRNIREGTDERNGKLARIPN